MSAQDQSSGAWPVADSALQAEILDLVQQCSHYRYGVPSEYLTETSANTQ